MKRLILMLLVLSSVTFSQELNCIITVNMDNIPNSSRDLLSGFQQAVSDYMNKTRFTSGDWQGTKISCGLSIFFLSTSNDINYTAQVVVTSQRPVYNSDKNSLVLSINDNTWSFTYQKGQSFLPNQSTFDPITSFLDYYANVIIGFDMDSWEEYSGTPYFSKAVNLTNLASTSSFSKGWVRSSGSYSRAALVEDLLNDKYRPFREAFYQYYYGIDYCVVNKGKGVEYIVKAINLIYSMKDQIDFSNVLLKTFFDAKSGEIAEYLKDYPDKNIFTILKKIDPSHTSKYDALM